MKHFLYTIRIPVDYKDNKAIALYDLNTIKKDIITSGYTIFDSNPVFSTDKEFQYISYKVFKEDTTGTERNKERAIATKAMWDKISGVNSLDKE